MNWVCVLTDNHKQLHELTSAKLATTATNMLTLPCINKLTLTDQTGQVHVNDDLPVKQPPRRRSCLCSSDNPETVSRCTTARWPPPAGGCWSGQGEQARPRMSRPSRWYRGTLLGQAWWALTCRRQQPSLTLWPRARALDRGWVRTEGLSNPPSSQKLCSIAWAAHGPTAVEGLCNVSLQTPATLECIGWKLVLGLSCTPIG